MLEMLLLGHCALMQADTSCQTFGNAYLKYTHFDQYIQKEQDKFVKNNEMIVTFGGAAYLVAQRHARFPLYSGLIVDLNAQTNQEGFSFQWNFGF